MGFMQIFYPVEEFGDVGFCGGRKTGEPGEDPLGKAKTVKPLKS